MPDYILGVYNYCDRWCERCPLTARCRVFAMEQSFRHHSDAENARFWTAFEQFPAQPESATKDDDAAPDDGLASSLDFEPDSGFESEDDSFERARRDPLSRAAMDYAFQMREWLSQQGRRDEAARRSSDPETVEREDALDVLSWYSLQIGVKMTRAMSGQLDLEDDAEFATPADEIDWRDDEADDELDPEFPARTDTEFAAGQDSESTDAEPWDDDVSAALRDAHRTDRDGSAKVALIGIERSLGALTILRCELPAEDATIRYLFRQLSQLRVQIDRRWPNARTFRRPGFDD